MGISIDDYIHKFGFDTFVANVDKELIALMKENPDFVYPDIYLSGGRYCLYHSGPESNPEKCSGCIFGQAFQRLGIETRTLDGTINSVTIGRATHYWREIQSRQDAGSPWGELLCLMPIHVQSKINQEAV